MTVAMLVLLENMIKIEHKNDIPGDQYNASWGYGCKGAGYHSQMNDIKAMTAITTTKI